MKLVEVYVNGVVNGYIQAHNDDADSAIDERIACDERWKDIPDTQVEWEIIQEDVD